jgi:predicted  nucleic acid-binding Zn-ribbon protein
MNHNVRMWTAKLRAAQVEERQWAKAYNKAERAMLRVGKEIEELEKKIGNELAKIEQRTGADERGTGVGAAE